MGPRVRDDRVFPDLRSANPAGGLQRVTATAISSGMSGLAFGLIHLRRRSVIEAAASHAAADILAVIAATLLVSSAGA